MIKLLLPATDGTPEFNFDHYKHILMISGRSRAEDARDLFKPVMDWLALYRTKVLERIAKEEFEENPIKLIIKMSYFNSPTTKALFGMFREIFSFNQEGYLVDVDWHYQEGDDDMLEMGEEFSELFESPFNLIET